MLVLASLVFLYYTTWTLLMVPSPDRGAIRFALICAVALRRQRPSSARFLPAKGMGDPHTCYFDTVRLCCRRELSQRGHDKE